MEACNSSNATYLFQQDKHYDLAYDTGDKAIQCGRHNDVFKLWLAWRAKGEQGFGKQIDRFMDMSKFVCLDLWTTTGKTETEKSENENKFVFLTNQDGWVKRDACPLPPVFAMFSFIFNLCLVVSWGTAKTLVLPQYRSHPLQSASRFLTAIVDCILAASSCSLFFYKLLCFSSSSWLLLASVSIKYSHFVSSYFFPNGTSETPLYFCLVENSTLIYFVAGGWQSTR